MRNLGSARFRLTTHRNSQEMWDPPGTTHRDSQETWGLPGTIRKHCWNKVISVGYLAGRPDGRRENLDSRSAQCHGLPRLAQAGLTNHFPAWMIFRSIRGSPPRGKWEISIDGFIIHRGIWTIPIGELMIFVDQWTISLHK